MSKFFILSIFIICSWVTATRAQEQYLTESDTVNLEEVVITASKVPLEQKQTAKPVTIIPRQEIARSAGKNLSQLLTEQAGILINGGYSNPGAIKNIYLRGADPGYTLILIDGIPIADPSGVGGAFDIRLLPLQLIERIEILKGSQSTLYGSDAIAGVINIITRKSVNNPLTLSQSLSAGSFNTINGTAGVRGKVGKVGFNADYQKKITGGITEALPPSDTANFDRDGFSQDAFQTNLSINLSDHWRISPFFRWSDFDGDYDGGAFADADNQYTNEVMNTGLIGRYNGNRLSASFSYSYTDTDRSFNTTFGTSQFNGIFQQADGFVSYDLGIGKALVGLNYQHQQLRDTTFSNPEPTATITSPYLTFLLQNAGGLNLELGYRLNNHSVFGNAQTFSLAPSYQLTSFLTIFGAYTTGFKAPTLFELYSAQYGNLELDPQTSTTWESGATVRGLQGDLRVSATYFRRSIENQVVFFFNPGYLNQDEQNDEGVEVEARWNILPAVSVSGNYTFLDGQVTTRGSNEQDSTYFNLIRRPKHQVQLNVRVEPVNNLLLNLQFQHLGERDDIFFDPSSFQQVTTQLNPYTLLNLYAEYAIRNQGVTCFADLKNLTNTQYIESTGFNTPGFNLQAGIRVNLTIVNHE